MRTGDLVSVVLMVTGVALPVAVVQRRAYDPALLMLSVHVGATLALFGAGLRSVPGPPLRRRSVALEPPRGPIPVFPRWQRVTLTSREPGQPDVRVPARCPGCADEDVSWLHAMATKERGGLTAALVTLGMPPIVGDLFGRAITEVHAVQVPMCEPCLALAAARERSRVVLRALCVAVGVVAIASSLLSGHHGPPLAVSVMGVAALALASYGVHVARFSGRRARPASLAHGHPVRGRLTPLSPGWGPVRWKLEVEACDPTWLLELVALNAAGSEAELDAEVLRSHAHELRRAGLR